MNFDQTKLLLDERYEKFAIPEFICNDPIQVPHEFTQKEDIEISAFITSLIAWGNRTMIIKNAKHFMQLLDNEPYNYVINHSEKDLSLLEKATHRTFNGNDFCFFVRSLSNIYANHGGLEAIFSQYEMVQENLIHAYKTIFEIEHEQRNLRHVSDITKGSAAKRLNMFLRWMVRNDGRGIDFGIWESIKPANLLVPLDVHCGREARNLGLLTRKANDWKAVLELTSMLKQFDAKDPIKYDFALFGTGVNKNEMQ